MHTCFLLEFGFWALPPFNWSEVKMTNQGSAQIRLVKCPRCRKILPELPELPIYKCGVCGTVLQGSLFSYSTAYM